MEQKIRRFHPPAFKARVVLEAVKEQKTLAELSSQFGIHAMMIAKWKGQAEKLLTEGFSDKRQEREKDDHDLVQELYRQIGRLKVEVDFLKKKMGITE
jgi:transposase-like protein